MTVYNIIHGPEFWLAVAIWGIGAMCGIAASWAAIEINDRREERLESDTSRLDNSGGGGGGSAPRRDFDSGGGRQ